MMKRSTFWINNLVVLSLILMSVASIFPNSPAAAAPAVDLFFSEYIEGSSNNKALEIYNGTGSAVDLAAGNYKILMYFNGSSSASTTIDLSGTVAGGDVFVLAHASANPTILTLADQTNNSSWFNGDDAVVLLKGTTVLDVIGQIGSDPGSEWGTGDTSTANNTLQRMSSICTGDPIGSDSFDPAIEWVGLAQDDITGLGAHTADCGGTGVQEPVINEFSASTSGTDVEYVEVFGPALTDFSAYTVLEIEGDSNSNMGVIDEIITIGTTDADGLYLANLPANALENGTITLLLVKSFSGSMNADLDADNDGTFDSTPWGSVVDAVAVNDGGTGDLTYGVPVLSPNYDGISSFAPGGASRIPDGFDTDVASDWVRNDFDLAGIPGFSGTAIIGEAYNTPGAANEVYVAPPEACGDPFTSIYAIQGSDAASPIVGDEVATEGVVVGDFQTGGFKGFHIQDPLGDGDKATSDGIFVYAPSAMDVNLGDVLRVRGKVSEYNSLTEISASQVWLCATGSSIAPTEISLPVTSVDTFEAFEGMLVTFPQALVISEYYNYDRFGELVLTSRRHLTPTAEFEPGSPEAMQAMQDYLLDSITLDDGRSSQNPDPAIHPNGLEFNLNNLFRGGDLLKNVTGVMDYSFGLYRIQPTVGADYTPTNLRTETPMDTGGNLTVASFNVLNYFSTIDNAGPICGPESDQDCRGADTAEEFTRQRAKIISALEAIDADIVGLIELENHPTDAALIDLVEGLNDKMGAGTYAYVATGPYGTDAIKQAFIYKPAAVSLVGRFALLDSSVDSRFIDTKNRPALAQTFMNNQTGGIFTAVVNHLKSKGSDCNDLGDTDLGDGAGNCNLTRKAAAEALVDWLASDPTGSGDADFLILGDLNSYDKEDPIDALLAGGYTDLIFTNLGEDAYSYVFDGQTGYLDHALAASDLVGEVSGVTIWHINADEPDLIDYDMSFKLTAQDAIYAPDAYRSSDHDPVIVGLKVCDEIAPTLSVSVTPEMLWPANHKYVRVQVEVTASDNFDPNPAVTLVSVTSNEADNGLGDGDTPNDIQIVDDYTFNLRAERSALGEGRTYTITYLVTDACGNSSTASATVYVPLNMGKKK